MKKILTYLLLVTLTACSTVLKEADVTGGIQSTFRGLETTQEAGAKQTAAFQGYDAIALAKYCDTYLRAPRLPALSTLLSTFGDPLPCVEQAARKGFLQVVQIDLVDYTCYRNKVCPAGMPRQGDLQVIESRAAKVRTLAVRYPGVTWQLSPALEHDIKDPFLVTKMLEAAKRGCPECKVINSPYSGARPGGYPIELHGTNVKAFSVSGDGKSSFDGDNIKNDGNNFQHRTSGSFTTYVWWPELNLRTTGEHTFTTPLKRTVRPTIEQFRQAALIMRSEEPAIPPAPKVCRSSRTVNGKKGEILKTNSEQYGNGVPEDPRGNKLLLIITKAGKRKGELLNIYSRGGKKIGCFSYYGPYTSKGLYRWYMGACSKMTPYDFYKANDYQEWAFADLGSGQCLAVNTLRRVGTYR